MKNDHHAALADFGLAATLSTKTTMASVRGGTVRWMAPELLYPEDYGFTHCTPSKESDMYALAMVIYEVCLNSQLHELKVSNLWMTS